MRTSKEILRAYGLFEDAKTYTAKHLKDKYDISDTWALNYIKYKRSIPKEVHNFYNIQKKLGVVVLTRLDDFEANRVPFRVTQGKFKGMEAIVDYDTFVAPHFAPSFAILNLDSKKVYTTLELQKLGYEVRHIDAKVIDSLRTRFTVQALYQGKKVTLLTSDIIKLLFKTEKDYY